MYIILVIPITVGLVGNWSVRYRKAHEWRAPAAAPIRITRSPRAHADARLSVVAVWSPRAACEVRHDRNARTELKNTFAVLLFIPHSTRTERRGRKSPPAYYPAIKPSRVSHTARACSTQTRSPWPVGRAAQGIGRAASARQAWLGLGSRLGLGLGLGLLGLNYAGVLQKV